MIEAGKNVAVLIEVIIIYSNFLPVDDDVAPN